MSKPVPTPPGLEKTRFGAASLLALKTTKTAAQTAEWEAPSPAPTAEPPAPAQEEAQAQLPKVGLPPEDMQPPEGPATSPLREVVPSADVDEEDVDLEPPPALLPAARPPAARTRESPQRHHLHIATQSPAYHRFLQRLAMRLSDRSPARLTAAMIVRAFLDALRESKFNLDGCSSEMELKERFLAALSKKPA